MNKIELSEEALHILQQMEKSDATNAFFGIKINEARQGFVKGSLTILPEMINSVGVAHGGICFALADTCCGIAVNLHGRKCVSTETSINQFRPALAGQTIFCTTKEEFMGEKIAVMTGEVFSPEGERIALFKGSYYRSAKTW